MNKVTIKHIEPAFEDNRGKILDLLDDEEIMHVGLITSESGAIRGNHYHGVTKQFNYILRGSGILKIKYLDNDRSEGTFNIKAGDFISIPPRVIHTIIAEEYLEFLDLNTLTRNDDGYEKDTIRV
jgi:quercetin dioxygenase-like cupin family protein